MRDRYLWRATGGDCRLVWVQENATASFWDRSWAAASLSTLVAEARRDRAMLQTLLRYSPPGGRVLEGGCGVGQWVVVLREHGRMAVGLDFAQETLCATARDPAPGSRPVAAGDVRLLPFLDKTFDTYVSLGVAEHFPAGPEPLLCEARRVLRPGGYLLVSVPYFSPLRRLRACVRSYPRLAAEYRPDAEFYQFAFTTSEFGRLLSAAGFAVVACEPLNALGGLAAEVPWVSLAHDYVVGATRSPAPRTGKGSGRPAGRSGLPRPDDEQKDGRHSVAERGKSAVKGLLQTRYARWLTGHMVLFAARRQC